MSDIKKGFWQNRLDLYIDNGDTGYIIEAKGSQQNDKLFSLIDDDIARIKSIEMKKSFKSMRKTKIPQKIISDILTETNTPNGKYEILKTIKAFNYPIKIVFVKEDNIITIITVYPLKNRKSI